MPDILLIQPPIRDFYITSKRTIPYGLACIAAALHREGFTADIFDALATSKSRVIDLPEEMNYLRSFYKGPDQSPFALFYHFRHFGYSFEHIGSVARDSGAFLVGVSSLFTPYADEALKVAIVVKTFHPGCKIVLGGHHPTAMPESVMKCDAVDFILRGEGEVSMPLLAKLLKAGIFPKKVPGIVYRKSNSSIHINPPVIMEKPDQYPMPAMHLVKHRFYKRQGKNSTVIVTSRGCPMKCTYCAVNASSYLKYRQRSVQSVLNEIKNAVEKYDIGFIDFEDENVSYNRNWFLALMNGIINEFGIRNIELRAMNGLFPPTLDEEMIQVMKSAGFKILNLSVCSSSKSQLEKFNRPDSCNAFDKVLQLAEKYGLDAVAYIIAGAPGQNPEESVSDLLYLSERKVVAGVSVFYPAPGSSDYKLCETLKLLPDSFSLMRSTALPVSHTTSRKDSVTLLRLSRLLNFMKYIADKESTHKDHSNTKAVPFKGNMNYGLKLLESFLQDGIIRGIDPDGNIFQHEISLDLTRKFLSNLKQKKKHWKF